MTFIAKKSSFNSKLSEIHSEATPSEAKLICGVCSTALSTLLVCAGISCSETAEAAPCRVSSAETEEISTTATSEAAKTAETGIKDALRALFHLFLCGCVFSSEPSVSEGLWNFFFRFEEVFAEAFEGFRGV